MKIFSIIPFSFCFLFLLMPSISHAKTWEYHVVTYQLIGNDKAIKNEFNKLGEHHWELVNCTEGDAKITCFFKRGKS